MNDKLDPDDPRKLTADRMNLKTMGRMSCRAPPWCFMIANVDPSQQFRRDFIGPGEERIEPLMLFKFNHVLFENHEKELSEAEVETCRQAVKDLEARVEQAAADKKNALEKLLQERENASSIGFAKPLAASSA